jgi:uroporphyrinogen-III synthase
MLPPNLKIAAIGSATARALEALGLPLNLLPPQAVAESLADQLLPHVRQPDGSPTRFLLLRAEIARELLPDTLRAAGADVTVAPVYRNLVPSDSIAAVRRLFSVRDLRPAAITFTSSSTATNLLAILEVAGLRLPQEILRISIGPITSQTLRDLNYPPQAEATESTLPSLVAAVVKALNLKKLP